LSRALTIRVLLTVVAIAGIVITELRATGVWTASRIPFHAIEAAGGRFVVHARSDLPLPPPLREGDVLAPEAMTPAARGAVFFSVRLPAETRFVVAVRRSGGIVSGAITTEAITLSGLQRFARWLNALFAAPLLATLALLTLWRGRGRASRALCTFSMFAVVTSGLLNAVTPPLVAAFSYVFVYVGQYIVALPALYLMSEAMADTGLSPRARRAARLTVASLMGVASVIAATTTIGFIVSGLTMTPVLNQLTTLMAGMLLALALLVLLAGYRRADHESRLRIRWVLWSTACFLAIVICLVVISAQRHPYLAAIVHYAEWLPLIGYLYAALRSRLVDVSFVVNRALLYTAITALLFGIFSVLELGLHQLAIGDRLSWALQAIAALLLAIALSPLHKRLEHGLERALFRRQRLAIASLRNFAVECGYIEQESRLLEIAVEKLMRQCDAVAIYERARGGYALRVSRGRAWPETVEADDAAFIALRARRQEIDLHQLGSALATESLAFPMTTAELLTGAVICMPRDGERFAPDVRATLLEVARSLGTALYILRYREQARLVADIAAGRIDENAARTRAAAMIAGTL
jgi:hypothetical protein